MEGDGLSAARRIARHCLGLMAGLACAWPLPLPASLNVSRWSMEEGLPHNLVNALAQDRSGRVWVGSWEGVAQFNGREFKAFDRQNTPGLEVSGVFVMQADGDGMLVGTVANGIYRYDGGRWSSLGDAAVRHLGVSALCRDRDGSLWLASRRALYRIDGDGRSRRILAIGLPDEPVRALLDLESGLLLGMRAGLFLLPRDGGVAHPWPGPGLAAPRGVRALLGRGPRVVVASDDGAWVCTAQGCLRQLHPGERIDAVGEDDLGNLWLVFNSGRLERHGLDGREVQVALPGAASPAVMVGRDGVVWVGTNQGLVRIMEGSAGGLAGENGLVSDYVRVVTQSPGGRIWIGHAEGLSRLSGNRAVTVPLRPRARRQPSVLALAATDDGGVWAGTYGAGVARVGPDGRVRAWLGRNQGLNSLTVRALLVDPDQRGVWIGTDDGLVHHRDGRLRRYGVANGLADASVLALYREPDGTLWAGTDQGMARLPPGGSRFRQWHPGPSFPAQTVFDFLRDPGGSLWIASDRGLLRLRNDRFQVYDHRAGLPRDALFRILDDGRGHVWLTSNRGVFRIGWHQFDEFDAGRRTALAVAVLDASDGLPSSQANGSSQPAGWMADDGRILVPTSAGLGVIVPGQVPFEHPPPVPVVIEAVAIDGGLQPVVDGQRIDGGLRRIAIDYAGLNYRAPAKVRYRYRLRGFEDDWVEAGSATRAIYTNLAPGHYRFEVQAMSLPLDWSQQAYVGQARLGWYLQPSWWQRKDLQWLAGGSLLALLASGYLLRVAGFRRRQRRLNAEIAAQTRELSEKNRSLEALGREREGLLRQLEYQAGHDLLTGLPNRREAERHLSLALARAGRGEPLALALLDLDRFKAINDTWGHAVGDEVLQRLGAVLAELADGRRVFAARHGGEEFMLVLTGLDRGQVCSLLQQLRQRVAGLRVITGGDTEVCCSLSIGLAWHGQRRRTRCELFEEADRQLYRAKREGRDRVCCEDEEPA